MVTYRLQGSGWGKILNLSRWASPHALTCRARATNGGGLGEVKPVGGDKPFFVWGASATVRQDRDNKHEEQNHTLRRRINLRVFDVCARICLSRAIQAKRLRDFPCALDLAI